MSLYLILGWILPLKKKKKKKKFRIKNQARIWLIFSKLKKK